MTSENHPGEWVSYIKIIIIIIITFQSINGKPCLRCRRSKPSAFFRRVRGPAPTQATENPFI